MLHWKYFITVIGQIITDSSKLVKKLKKIPLFSSIIQSGKQEFFHSYLYSLAKENVKYWSCCVFVAQFENKNYRYGSEEMQDKVFQRDIYEESLYIVC